MARMIDGDAVKRRIWGIVETWKFQGRKYDALLLESVIAQIVDPQPTLTPPNEWISVEERLPEESDGMVLLTDGISVRTGYRNWMFRMDDYPIVFVPGQKKGGGEMAVTHWMKISAPPNRRPPEGEA